MVTKAELEKLKIDVVDELHRVRKKYVNASSEDIEKTAAEIRKEINKRRKKSR